MASVSFKVYPPANKKANVCSLGWDGSSVSEIKIPAAWGDIRVSFGDGKVETYRVGSTLKREDSMQRKPWSVTYSQAWTTIRHIYPERKSYTVTVSSTNKFPFVFWRGSNVTEFCDPLPAPHGRDGSPVQFICDWFSYSSLKIAKDDMFKNCVSMVGIYGFFDESSIKTVEQHALDGLVSLEEVDYMFWHSMSLDCDVWLMPEGVERTNHVAWTRPSRWDWLNKVNHGHFMVCKRDSKTWQTFSHDAWSKAMFPAGVRAPRGDKPPTTAPFEEFYMPDGRRLDAVFYPTHAGTQDLGYFSVEGIDIGRKFATGESPETTEYYHKGVDIGRVLLSGASTVYAKPIGQFAFVKSGYRFHMKVSPKWKVYGSSGKVECLRVYSPNCGSHAWTKTYTFSEKTKELATEFQFDEWKCYGLSPIYAIFRDKVTGQIYVTEPYLVGRVSDYSYHVACNSDCGKDCGCDSHCRDYCSDGDGGDHDDRM